jgi:hypothetical protein
MNQKNVIQEGGCRYGQVRIKVTVPPFLTMACHRWRPARYDPPLLLPPLHELDVHSARRF